MPNGFAGPVGSVVITPLPGHGVPAGALVLLRRSSHTAFSEGEEVLARLFAARAGLNLPREPPLQDAFPARGRTMSGLFFYFSVAS